MVRIVDNPCSCGQGFSFEGTRRDERVARAAWDMDHAVCWQAPGAVLHVGGWAISVNPIPVEEFPGGTELLQNTFTDAVGNVAVLEARVEEPTVEVPPPNDLEGTFETSHGEVVEVHRDAGSGEFVTAEFADEHPATTVGETVERPARHRRQR